jgi:excisionase family DNA binding protein
MGALSYEIPTARRMLKVKEAAMALGIAEHTLRVWLMTGRVSFCKVGRGTRVPEGEILRLLAEGWKGRKQ